MLASLRGIDLGIVALVFGFLCLRIFMPERIRAKRPWRPRPAAFRPASPFATPTDATEQLRSVMLSRFTAKRVLSATEQRVMVAAEAAVAEAGLAWRVLPQVALGEVLSSPDEAGFRAINAKRTDLLIVSERSMPIAAIEYQGEGHWQGSAPARDAVKKEALRRAGVGYIEITADHGPEDVRREILRLAGTGAYHDIDRA